MEVLPNELRSDVQQIEIPASVSATVQKSLLATSENESSDSENVSKPFIKRAQRLSDSENDSIIREKSCYGTESGRETPRIADSDDEVAQNISHQRSRICKISSDSEEADTETLVSRDVKSRTETKSKKLKNKFKKILKKNKSKINENKYDSKSSSDSDGESNSIERIKKKIQDRNNYLKATLYDPETSDDENLQRHQEKSLPKKKERKVAKLTSPKPIKMTAKQAMENMQKIKSESNRMLREKEVSLPYHRPKALSLKDIMSKCRSAVTSEGKALPIKMNDEQLKQYVKMLEERQKEVILLCKSDTEEEDNNSDGEKNEASEKSVFDDVNNDSNKDSCTNTEPDNKSLEVISDTACKMNEDTHCSDLTELLNKNKTDNVLSANDETKEEESEHKILENHATDAKPEANTNIGTESDSQVLNLHYTETDTERNTTDSEAQNNPTLPEEKTAVLCDKNINDRIFNETEEINLKDSDNADNDGFPDDDINMMDIDALIENAEIIKEPQDDNMGLSDASTKGNFLKINPTLTGGPGLLIDLDNISDSFSPKSLSGVELLKERYIYFAKLKTPEEMEREKEKRDKPGAQHLKLKHELEEKMAEQRSLEWAKRLAEEKAHQMEVNAVIGDHDEDDIEKLEAKLEEDDDNVDEENSEIDEELVEDDCDMTDKPKKRNSMVDDEAEESDEDENASPDEDINEPDDADESEGSTEESSESEAEIDDSKPKKGRILKAFEDSDDETAEPKLNETTPNTNIQDVKEVTQKPGDTPVKDSQDDELQLAQMQRSFSEDLFASQSSGKVTNSDKVDDSEKQCDDKTLGTQSFSIMENGDINSSDLAADDNFSMTCESQLPVEEVGSEVAELLDKLPQNLIGSQLPTTQTQVFGDDVLALCTGNFYDNKFVSQTDVNTVDINASQESEKTALADTKTLESQHITDAAVSEKNIDNCDVLKSILNELDSPDFDVPKSNKFFVGNTQEVVEKKDAQSNQLKKKFIIDSDDEGTENNDIKKVKRKKKKRMQNRVLQISDDEDELDDEEEQYESEIEEDNEEKVVEYDSEENEVVTLAPGKTKKKVTDFFEAEAELSSNEEWSGDEDERGLDVMEREEGDQDVFQQGRLQSELGAIHMREVLDQDKREVRMIQELLFEDGDLGDGHRQRRFRWKDINGEDIDYSTIPVFSQNQDDDFESVEQWRKQRYEREMFLKKMRLETDNEDINEMPLVDNIIKLNDTAASTTIVNEIATEKKGAKDIPSPRKPLGLFQTSYRGSILRGSSLGRLAALAAPLLDQESTTNLVSGNKRNFVFAAHEQPKVPKRKAPINEGTPKLIKKLKTEQTMKNSLLDHLNK